MATPFAPESRLPLVQISCIYRKTTAKAWNCLEYIGHPEKQDYFFRCSVAHGNFPFSKSRVPFTFRQVNNHDHEHRHAPRKIKNIRICMGKNLPFQKKTTKMKGIQLKRKIFHWELLKIFSLGIWPRGRDEDRRGTRLPFGARNFCRTFRDRRVFVFCRNNFLECPVTVRSRLCTCHWKGWGFVGAYTCPRGEV